MDCDLDSLHSALRLAPAAQPGGTKGTPSRPILTLYYDVSEGLDGEEGDMFLLLLLIGRCRMGAKESNEESWKRERDEVDRETDNGSVASTGVSLKYKFSQ